MSNKLNCPKKRCNDTDLGQIDDHMMCDFFCRGCGALLTTDQVAS